MDANRRVQRQVTASRRGVCVFVGLTVFSAACSTIPVSIRPPTGAAPQRMVASWYGAEFHGRPTASGERFDPNGLTCAHRSLPFGTVLHVRNPQTGASVLVTVNDRGPWIDGRDLDLSRAAAQRLGLVSSGVAAVDVEIVERGDGKVASGRGATYGILGGW